MLDQVIIRKPVPYQTSHLSKNQHSPSYTSQIPGHHSWQLPLPHSPLSFIPTEDILLFFPSPLPSLKAKLRVFFSRTRNSLAGLQESILARFQSVLHTVANDSFRKHTFMSFHCLKLGFLCVCTLNKSLILQSRSGVSLSASFNSHPSPLLIKPQEREPSFTTLPNRLLIILCLWIWLISSRSLWIL